jgi:hypothetical protein
VRGSPAAGRATMTAPTSAPGAGGMVTSEGANRRSGGEGSLRWHSAAALRRWPCEVALSGKLHNPRTLPPLPTPRARPGPRTLRQPRTDSDRSRVSPPNAASAGPRSPAQPGPPSDSDVRRASAGSAAARSASVRGADTRERSSDFSARNLLQRAEGGWRGRGRGEGRGVWSAARRPGGWRLSGPEGGSAVMGTAAARAGCGAGDERLRSGGRGSCETGNTSPSARPAVRSAPLLPWRGAVGPVCCCRCCRGLGCARRPGAAPQRLQACGQRAYNGHIFPFTLARGAARLVLASSTQSRRPPAVSGTRSAGTRHPCAPACHSRCPQRPGWPRRPAEAPWRPLLPGPTTRCLEPSLTAPGLCVRVVVTCVSTNKDGLVPGMCWSMHRRRSNSPRAVQTKIDCAMGRARRDL